MHNSISSITSSCEQDISCGGFSPLHKLLRYRREFNIIQCNEYDFVLRDELLVFINDVNTLHYTPFMLACANGYTNMVRRLLKYYLNIYGKTLNEILNKKNYAGNTALLLAFKNNHLDIQKILIHFYLKHGILNINDQNLNGDTILLYACNYGSNTMVNFLLSRADPAIILHRNKFNFNALMACFDHHNLSLVTHILAKLPEDFRFDNYQDTFQNLCISAETPLIELMIEYGVIVKNLTNPFIGFYIYMSNNYKTQFNILINCKNAVLSKQKKQITKLSAELCVVSADLHNYLEQLKNIKSRPSHLGGIHYEAAKSRFIANQR